MIESVKAAVRRWLGLVFQKMHMSLSALGQRLGWEWLTYNPLVIMSFERAARRNAPKFADAVLLEFPNLHSLADVGCGTGNFAAEFKKRGLTVIGCEYNRSARARARRKSVEAIDFDLSHLSQKLPGTPYDIAISLEVGEHVPPDLADALVVYLASTSDVIVFTAAQPGQGGHGHVNEQPLTYWDAKFRAHGLVIDQSATARIAQHLRELEAFPYLSDNLLVLRQTRTQTGFSSAP